MIRYPKRNIAQKTEKQPLTIIPIENTGITDNPPMEPIQKIIEAHPPSLPAPIDATVKPTKYFPSKLKRAHALRVGDDGEEINCRNAKWHNILYPAKLWQMNDDLDQFAYGNMQKLPLIEQQKIQDRLPGSISLAEKKADEVLKAFLQSSIQQMGKENYIRILESAATDDSKILFALRCAIAASQPQVAEEDAFVIYQNDEMRGSHFYPDSCKKTGTDPKTGEEMVYYEENPAQKSDKEYGPYWRSENHISKQHSVWRRIKNPQPGKLDKMPATIFKDMQEVLLQYNIIIDTHTDAWKLIDQCSKRASVEDRILARIMYLIANAQHNKT